MMPEIQKAQDLPLESTHRDVFLETAAELCAKVCRDALWADGSCNWIGPAMEPFDGKWRQVFKAFGPEFYGGTSGVAVSLAALYESTGERLFRKTALAAMRHALNRAEDLEPTARIGLYSGWCGIALAALRVSDLLGVESLAEAGIGLSSRLTESLLTAPPDYSNTDVLAGAAGAAVALLILNSRFPDHSRLIDAAVRLGDQLIESAVKDEHGWSWGELHKPDSGAFGNLTGYSHGAAGIGWAHFELHNATQEKRFFEAAEAAFAYERHWFDTETGNWPDLRDPELSGGSRTSGPSFMNAWCHGAPGIALSRLRTYKLLGSQSSRDEAETAIATTLKNLYGTSEMSQTNYSLCHGLGGNCEPLIYGASILDRPEWFQKAEEAALRGIDAYQKKRMAWPCGGPAGLETANLMLGLAGIAYFYMRIAEPARVPSVLIFEVPANH